MQQHESCEQCGGTAYKFLTVPMIVADARPYSCPITGKPIEGKRAHVENLKKHRCRVLEPGETADLIKNKPKRDAEALDRSIDRVVDSAARSMGIIPE